MRVLFLMLIFLSVDKPVAAIQFDLETTGAVALEPGMTKQISSARVNGRLRVIVYGLDQNVFSGRFARVDAPVASISGVVAAAPDGTEVAVRVVKLSPPANVRKR